jgi:pimeloyl-ACP methyl ester carboxylesterase
MRRWLLAAGVPIALAVAALAVAIAAGGPRTPPRMATIDAPFGHVDWSDLPGIERFTARDGTSLAYRRYAPAGAPARGAVVLVHGSSARGASMHPLARRLARAGYAVLAPDVRGHGASGTRGRIAYVGQLEDDLEDLVRALDVPEPRVLAGFSAGGGFALRFAGGPRQRLFDRYLLLAPFLHQDAPTFRPGGGGWVDVGVPRLVALGVLNRVGVTALNHLPVAAFAIAPEDRAILTSSYGYALAVSFRPHEDWRADLRGAEERLDVVVGADDEVLQADRFEAVLREAGRPAPVTVVPGVDHIGLTLSPVGVDAVARALER